MANEVIHRQIEVDDFLIDAEITGQGEPLLLLHGFPETKLAWRKIVPVLANNHKVILVDIPGYGASTGPPAAADYSNYSKRSIGNVLRSLVRILGFEMYLLAGHDRGARIAYRMALDHPKEIKKLALLNIIPTAEVAERMNYERAYNMENWLFLSQPAPLPETLIGSNASFYLNHILDAWSVYPHQIPKEIRQEYQKHFENPGVLEKICAEYRAFKFDLEYDQQDQLSWNKIKCPVFVLWSQNDFPDNQESPVSIWEKWADHVAGKRLSCGHFLMEEKPEQVAEELIAFFT